MAAKAPAFPLQCQAAEIKKCKRVRLLPPAESVSFKVAFQNPHLSLNSTRTYPQGFLLRLRPSFGWILLGMCFGQNMLRGLADKLGSWTQAKLQETKLWTALMGSSPARPRSIVLTRTALFSKWTNATLQRYPPPALPLMASQRSLLDEWGVELEFYPWLVWLNDPAPHTDRTAERRAASLTP